MVVNNGFRLCYGSIQITAAYGSTKTVSVNLPITYTLWTGVAITKFQTGSWGQTKYSGVPQNVVLNSSGCFR